jgi:hypothetical protein
VFSVLVEKMREMDEERKEMDKTTNIIFIYSLIAVYR